MIVVAVVIFVVVTNVQTRNAENDEFLRRRGSLYTDNATVRVCLRVTGDNVQSTVKAMHEMMKTAASPARLRFAVVTEGISENFVQAYMSACGGAAAAAARTQLRVFHEIQSESNGWLGAWASWHGRLADDETAVIVFNHHKHALRANWDKHVVRIAQELPPKGIFTACGPDAFPCLAYGNVEHGSFPRVVARRFRSRSAGEFMSVHSRSKETTERPFSPCVAVDKDMMVFAGRFCRPMATAHRACSLAETDVALSNALFEADCFFHTRCEAWFGPQCAELWWAAERDAKLWMPAGATSITHAKSHDLSRKFQKYAGLRKLPEGLKEAVEYEINVRGRMGLTKSARRTAECERKYGTVEHAEMVRRTIQSSLQQQGWTHADDLDISEIRTASRHSDDEDEDGDSNAKEVRTHS